MRAAQEARWLRWSALALALLVAAWFGLGVYQATSQSKAEAIIAGAPHLSASRATRAQDLLDAAGTLNPDLQVNIDRVALMLETRHVRAAMKLARWVTEMEPLNIEGWIWLAHATGGRPSVYYLALAELRILDPLASGF
jgi:hypothetical protein